MTTSKACCTIPPIVTKGYSEKGSYTDVEGLKTYTTGPATAKQGLLIIYDIFGFFPQTIQGADILAHADSSRPRRVFMPDFFKGEPMDLKNYPPDTDEKKKIVGEFFKGPAEATKMVGEVDAVIKTLKKENPDITSWGILGHCWGGKIVSLVSGANTPFSAGAQCHPAAVSADDAKKVTIPMCILASGDEPADDVKAFEEALTGHKHVETFGDQIHGWMAARGDLEKDRVKEEYERGYQILLDFYAKHL